MSKKNQAGLFIRMLAEEFKEFRKVGKFSFSCQVTVRESHLGKISKTDQKDSLDATNPFDCVQLMSTTPQRRIGQTFRAQ